MWISNQARCYTPAPMPGAYAETVTNSAMFASVSGGSSPTARAGPKGRGKTRFRHGVTRRLKESLHTLTELGRVSSTELCGPHLFHRRHGC
jgi:hypothetical protein